MRRTIQELAYARFQYEKPSLEASPKQLEFEALVGEMTKGGFTLTGNGQTAVRGMICSSHPRMRCVPSEFEGNSLTIGFEFDGAGLVEGDVVEGELTVIYNGGELSLPFAASMTRFYAASSQGTIRTLTDFTSLARNSWDEAYHIFKAPFFQNVIGEEEERERLLYKAVGASQAAVQGMEEFLVASSRKMRISFDVGESSRSFENLSADCRESVTLRKEGWGYLEISVTSDSEWLVPVKERLTTADFVGNQTSAEYVIIREKLHGGKNAGRLILESLHQRKEITLCVQGRTAENLKLRREKKELLARITRLYLKFRLGRMVTGVWSKESCECMERLKELEPDNLWFLLYHAQALLVNKQRQEAEWLLDRFRREPVKKDSPLYAYYLYLCTLKDQEPSNVARSYKKIRDICHKNQEDLRLFLIMLFLDPEFQQSGSRKLSAIEEKVTAGMHSPILYMEAYALLCHDVYLLKQAGAFEQQVLYWAAREGELTEAVAGQAGKCIGMVRVYHPLWYRILKECYEKYPDTQLLTALCSFCIKWGLVGKEQFAWYNAGVEQELRIAGLYEAWLDSAAHEHLLRFPRSVMIYFQYQSSGSFKKQALLYASIVRKKGILENLYESYQKQMEQFAYEQLRAGRIDENLAILYEEFIQEQTVDEELKQAFAQAADTYKVVCRDRHGRQVVVVQFGQKEVNRVPLLNHQAYVRLHGSRYCILLEDERGVRYLPKDGWRLERLMKLPVESESAVGQSECRERQGEAEAVSVSSRIVLAEQKIMELEGEAEEQLTALCAWIFRQGKYTERILRYLCQYFHGSLREMETLWQAAREFELSTYELEERFLVQLLYTGSRTEYMEQIFLSYFKARGREMVLLACMSYFSYQYFVKEMKIADEIFCCIQEQLLLGNSLNDCCRLACFLWLCRQMKRSEAQEKLLEELLMEYTKRQMFFAFYQELPVSLRRRYLLHDKVFLEYRTNPSHRVTIGWKDVGITERIPDNSRQDADMEDMYEGIFVKRFVLFGGEEIAYCLREEDQGRLVHTENGRIAAASLSNEPESKDYSQYGLLNQMAFCQENADQAGLQELFQGYLARKSQSEEKFRLL